MAYVGELKIYPVTLIKERPRSDLECGGKVVLPPTVLNILTSRANICVPMLFKITNLMSKKFTHCGVLEFIAEEGNINVPSWIMDLLCFKNGEMVKIESCSLPTAKFSRFQPQCVDFLDITNPKAVLENYLRHFSCLTEGDIIPIYYNERLYFIKVEETKPSGAVTIVECDMEVDFSPPIGYIEPEIIPVKPATDEIPDESALFRVFSGTGNRLDGKKSKLMKPDAPDTPPVRRGIPDYNYELGTLEFFRKN